MNGECKSVTLQVVCPLGVFDIRHATWNMQHSPTFWPRCKFYIIFSCPIRTVTGFCSRHASRVESLPAAHSHRVALNSPPLTLRALQLLRRRPSPYRPLNALADISLLLLPAQISCVAFKHTARLRKTHGVKPVSGPLIRYLPWIPSPATPLNQDRPPNPTIYRSLRPASHRQRQPVVVCG